MVVHMLMAGLAQGEPIKSAEETMKTSLQKSQLRRSNFLKKIKVEDNVSERREVIVRCEIAPLRWKGFECRMAIWNKIYKRV